MEIFSHAGEPSRCQNQQHHSTECYNINKLTYLRTEGKATRTNKTRPIYLQISELLQRPINVIERHWRQQTKLSELSNYLRRVSLTYNNCNTRTHHSIVLLETQPSWFWWVTRLLLSRNVIRVEVLHSISCWQDSKLTKITLSELVVTGFHYDGPKTHNSLLATVHYTSILYCCCYYYYFCLMAIFPHEPGSDGSPRVLHLFQNRTCEISGTGFPMGQVFFCHQPSVWTHWRERNSNQRPDLILSVSTTGLLMTPASNAPC